MQGITLTESAAKHVSNYMTKRGKGVGLRLGVRTTGCSGLAYKLEFADIMAFYRAHVAGRPLAIMVAGDPRKVKAKDLKRYGKVVRLREWQLYSQ